MLRSTLTILACCATPLWAMGDDAGGLDTDGDGMLSLAELRLAYPDLSADSFAEADANTDGLLDPTEMTAARASGLVPEDGEGIEEVEEVEEAPAEEG